MWTQIRLLLQEQSDLGLHYLSNRLLKHFSRQQKKMKFVVNGALKVYTEINLSARNTSA